MGVLLLGMNTGSELPLYAFGISTPQAHFPRVAPFVASRVLEQSESEGRQFRIVDSPFCHTLLHKR